MYEEGNKMMPGNLSQTFRLDDKNGGDDMWKWIFPFIFGGFGGGGYGGGYGGGGRHGGYGYSDADSATNQNVKNLHDTVRDNTSHSKFESLTAQVAAFQAAVTNGMNQSNLSTNAQFNDLCRQIAACCCDNRVATERTNTAIALSAKDLQAQMLQCCCDLKQQNAETQTALALHGKDVAKELCDQTSAILAQDERHTTQILSAIADNERSRLSEDLANARTELIMANQSKDEDKKFADINLTLQQIIGGMNGNGHGGH